MSTRDKLMSEFSIKLLGIKGLRFLAIKKTGVLNSSSNARPPFDNR